MRQMFQKAMVLYHGGHPSLTIFEDYVRGILAVYPDAHLIDYFDLYLRCGVKDFADRILQEVQINERDLIYILPASGDMTLSLELLEELSGHAYIVINFFDSELFFDNIDRHYAQAADLVLIPNPVSTSLFSSPGLRMYCAFSLFDPERYLCKNLERKIDVSFVGNITKGNRRQYIQSLQEAGLTPAVFGYGTPSGMIRHEQMVDLFNKTKINLNFSDAEESHLLLYAGKSTPAARQLKGRITEIALTGGFVLTEYAPGLEEMYEIGKEIEIFSDETEMQQKIGHYLAHEKERNTIAASGRQRALRDYDCHTGFRRVDALITNSKERRQIVHDQTFTRNQANFLFYYAVRFLLSFQFARAYFEIRHVCQIARPDLRQAVHLGARACAVYLRKNKMLKTLYEYFKMALLQHRKLRKAAE